MTPSQRPIDQRYVPPVSGIDLEQALNYVDIDVAGESFVYDHYTSARVFYRPGSRPKLQDVAARATSGAANDLETAQMLAKWVADQVRWAGFHMRDKGQRLADDQCPSEEHLVEYGYGWCNEQARLLCALTQICGLPSRIVFAFNRSERKGYGHCITEVLLNDGWMAVDQSLGFCFTIDRAPVRASRIYRDPTVRRHFTQPYTALCRALHQELGSIVDQDFVMATAAEPLDGFTNLGFHNHFVH